MTQSKCCLGAAGSMLCVADATGCTMGSFVACTTGSDCTASGGSCCVVPATGGGPAGSACMATCPGAAACGGDSTDCPNMGVGYSCQAIANTPTGVLGQCVMTADGGDDGGGMPDTGTTPDTGTPADASGG
jgi:hypothetical protein